MELNITGFQDLNQLEGFTITAMQLQRMDDNTPVVVMQVKSPYYDKPYDIRLFPTVEIHIKGRHIEALPGISLKGKHVEG